MNIIIPEICSSVEPGSWLWILAGCGMGYTALYQAALVAWPLALPVIAFLRGRHHAHAH